MRTDSKRKHLSTYTTSQTPARVASRGDRGRQSSMGTQIPLQATVRPAVVKVSFASPRDGAAGAPASLGEPCEAPSATPSSKRTFSLLLQRAAAGRRRARRLAARAGLGQGTCLCRHGGDQERPPGARRAEPSTPTPNRSRCSPHRTSETGRHRATAHGAEAHASAHRRPPLPGAAEARRPVSAAAKGVVASTRAPSYRLH